MKLKNKKTGEIGDLLPYACEDGKIRVWIDNISRPEYRYSSLAELNEEWEDYVEPKCIQDIYVPPLSPTECVIDFGTKEEAEKSIEKLKAWKRLKDKGFRFTLTPATGSLDATPDKFQIEINAEMPAKYFCCDAVQEDLDACFGGEE